jgi:hypothetical protein
MGLDMHAVRRLHVKQWNHQEPDERYLVTLTHGGKPVAGVEQDRISVVEEEVMYWRKANHIHRWFVENVQSGEDDCGDYLVSVEHLRELHNVCRRVLDSDKDNGDGIVVNPRVAHMLLPRQKGFFFGSVEYDQDYTDHVTATLTWATRMLAAYNDGVPGSIYYSSSW